MIDKKNILGVGITNATRKEILEYIIKNLENFKKKTFIVTPNPEFLVLSSKNTVFKSILNSADLALVDGVGIMIAAKMMGKSLRERFPGVDFVKSLCEAVSEKPITVGFLGGRGGVAESTAECLRKKYPGLKVAFAGEEWPINERLARQSRSLGDVRLQNSEKQSLAPVSLNKSRPQTETQPTFNSPKNGPPRFNNEGIDILFVAYGAPKQEFWINENLEKIPVKIAVGVGGAFDYISGKVPRAPGFIRAIGFEWLFRLVVQPWRIKRQLSLIEFVWLVVKEEFGKLSTS